MTVKGWLLFNYTIFMKDAYFSHSDQFEYNIIIIIIYIIPNEEINGKTVCARNTNFVIDGL